MYVCMCVYTHKSCLFVDVLFVWHLDGTLLHCLNRVTELTEYVLNIHRIIFLKMPLDPPKNRRTGIVNVDDFLTEES